MALYEQTKVTELETYIYCTKKHYQQK